MAATLLTMTALPGGLARAGAAWPAVRGASPAARSRCAAFITVCFSFIAMRVGSPPGVSAQN